MISNKIWMWETICRMTIIRIQDNSTTRKASLDHLLMGPDLLASKEVHQVISIKFSISRGLRHQALESEGHLRTHLVWDRPWWALQDRRLNRREMVCVSTFWKLECRNLRIFILKLMLVWTQDSTSWELRCLHTLPATSKSRPSNKSNRKTMAIKLHRAWRTINWKT